VPVAAHDQEIASDASGVRQDHIGYIHFSRNNVRELDLETVPSEMMRNIDAGDLMALGGLIGHEDYFDLFGAPEQGQSIAQSSGGAALPSQHTITQSSLKPLANVMA
jgi:hypothetical protein